MSERRQDCCDLSASVICADCPRQTVTIVLPSGYANAEEFAKDCGFELADHGRRDTIEACAKIADDQYDEAPAGPAWDGGGREVGWHDACSTIAKRIRSL